MKLALDTNAYGLCDTGHEEALAALARATALFLPAVAYGELYYGFRHGRRFAANLRRLDRFIRAFDVVVIAVDTEVAQLYGETFAALRAKGRPIPTNDVWIAAATLSVGVRRAPQVVSFVARPCSPPSPGRGFLRCYGERETHWKTDGRCRRPGPGWLVTPQVSCPT